MRGLIPWLHLGLGVGGLALRTEQKQRPCLIVYGAPKTGTRSVAHWASSRGLKIVFLSDILDHSEQVSAESLSADVYVGHEEFQLVRERIAQFIELGLHLKCFEWAQLREPRQRVVSHLLHLVKAGYAWESIYDSLDSPTYKPNHNPFFNTLDTMTYMFNRRGNVTAAVRVLLSLDGIIMNIGDDERSQAIRTWDDYFGIAPEAPSVERVGAQDTEWILDRVMFYTLRRELVDSLIERDRALYRRLLHSKVSRFISYPLIERGQLVDQNTLDVIGRISGKEAWVGSCWNVQNQFVLNRDANSGEVSGEGLNSLGPFSIKVTLTASHYFFVFTQYGEWPVKLSFADDGQSLVGKDLIQGTDARFTKVRGL